MALAIAITELYEILSQKIGKTEAKTLVEFIETKVDTSLEQKTNTLANKEDIAKLETKIAQTESKLILWAFVFWATQLGAMFAFLYFFLKK
jgi:hypothetical protein